MLITSARRETGGGGTAQHGSVDVWSLGVSRRDRPARYTVTGAAAEVAMCAHPRRYTAICTDTGSIAGSGPWTNG